MARPPAAASCHALNLSISTVDYNRKDPVFWIVANTNLDTYKHKHRRFPRYYSELKKLERHLGATLDDVLLNVLPVCPRPHHDKDGRMVPRQWWLHVTFTPDGLRPQHASEPPSPIDHHMTTESTTASSTRTSLSENDAAAATLPLSLDHRHSQSHLNPRKVWDMRIQLWLQRLADHPRVIASDGLREFIESEIGFRPQLPTRRRQKKISGFHHLQRDMEAEFNASVELLDLWATSLIDVQQQLIAFKTSMVLWSETWLDLASSWIAYGAIERDPSLFLVHKQMAKGTQKIADTEHSMGLLLSETLGEEVEYQMSNVVAAKVSMERRMRAFAEYMDSHRHTESCLRHVERLKSSSVIDRQQVTDVIADLEQARADEQHCLRDYERIDNNLQQDLVQYKSNMARDMIGTMQEYVKAQLHLERQKLMVWQSLAALS
ncbi:hypothetical protein BC940DRAFT_336645 [Gongronella butleri]|nr:hypothetical protein BC940DRAFT_336645 [Gongronella butleri]